MKRILIIGILCLLIISSLSLASMEEIKSKRGLECLKHFKRSPLDKEEMVFCA